MAILISKEGARLCQGAVNIPPPNTHTHITYTDTNIFVLQAIGAV